MQIPDRGGQAITVKQQCDRVVAADGALCQMLRDLSSQYTEEAAGFGMAAKQVLFVRSSSPAWPLKREV